ncbi:MAG: hypothetical protein JNM63_02035, partial [Spirochaetia bacterium]|nr:hypothetical protein [Spirochaetia bacterium]
MIYKIHILYRIPVLVLTGFALAAKMALAQNVLFDEADSLTGWKSLAAETGTVKEGKVSGLWQGAEK